MAASPPTTPNLGIPRYDDSGSADFGADINTIVDYIDNQLAQRMFKAGDLIVSVATSRAGAVLCDGSQPLGTVYPDLAAVLGTGSLSKFGAAPTGKIFLPDWRGRVIVGAGTGAGLSTRTMGDAAGEESHPLTRVENAPHNHWGFIRLPMNINRYDGGTSGSIDFGATGLPTHPDYAFYGDGASDSALLWDGGDNGVLPFWTLQGVPTGHPHNNMQPYAVANIFIKT